MRCSAVVCCYTYARRTCLASLSLKSLCSQDLFMHFTGMLWAASSSDQCFRSSLQCACIYMATSSLIRYCGRTCRFFWCLVTARPALSTFGRKLIELDLLICLVFCDTLYRTGIQKFIDSAVYFITSIVDGVHTFTLSINIYKDKKKSYLHKQKFSKRVFVSYVFS
jgi:hypothetical protein